MMTDESIMQFGMHKGKALANVPYSYLKWLYESGKCYGELKAYIEDNAEIIGIKTDNNGHKS